MHSRTEASKYVFFKCSGFDIRRDRQRHEKVRGFTCLKCNCVDYQNKYPKQTADIILLPAYASSADGSTTSFRVGRAIAVP